VSRPTLLLASILAAAAVLRFAGVAHDLARTGAEFDEDHNFADPVRRMWSKRTADPVVYSGYPGLFNHLAFAPMIAGQTLGGDVGAVAAGRALVAAFGVLNVFLVFRVCRPPMGTGPALAAAALMALNRAEVRAAHYITPDVPVVSALLALLLVVQREPRPGDPARMGALTAIATAVKYSGLLIAPAAVVGVLTTPRRGRGLALFAAAALGTFVVAAPYAVAGLGRPGMGAGLADVVGVYFGTAAGDLEGNKAVQGRGLALGDVAGELLVSVGPLPVLLAAVAALWGGPRRLAGAAGAVVAANVLVLAFANLIYSRHVLVLAAGVVVLAAAGAAGLRERWPATFGSPVGAAVLVLAVLLPAARQSVPLAVAYARPSPADRVAEWIEGHAAAGSAVATSYPRLDLDPARFEVRTFDSWKEIPAAALPHYDLLVLRSDGERAELPAAEVLASFAGGRQPVSVVHVARPALARIAPTTVEATTAPERAAAAFDGDPASVWPLPTGEATLTARWNEPREVQRVELDVGAREGWPQTVTLEGWEPGRDRPTPLRIFGVRPNHPSRQRASGPAGQVFVVDPPVMLVGLRMVRPDGGAWDVAELRVMAR
jgi:hypothetical protein